MKNTNDRRTYTVDEVTRLLGVSRGVAYEAVRTGRSRERDRRAGATRYWAACAKCAQGSSRGGSVSGVASGEVGRWRRLAAGQLRHGRRWDDDAATDGQGRKSQPALVALLRRPGRRSERPTLPIRTVRRIADEYCVVLEPWTKRLDLRSGACAEALT